MADITALQKKVANVTARQASAFIRDSTNTFNNFGRVKNVSVNAEPVTDEADVAGRDKALAYDLTVQLVLTQTSKTEISTIGSLSQPDGTDYPNGHYIFLSSEPTSDPDANADGTPDVDGFGFENVLPKPTLEVDLNGGESMLAIEFSGRVPADAFDNFDTDPIITLDA